MRFIPEDQSNNADEKVKDEVYKWWEENISIGDLFYNNIGCCIDGYVSQAQGKEAILGNTTPLLTVGQLIEFIEWKLKDEIDIYRAGMKGHQIAREWIDGVGECKYEFNTISHDLLESLWEVAQKICKRISVCLNKLEEEIKTSLILNSEV